MINWSRSNLHGSGGGWREDLYREPRSEHLQNVGVTWFEVNISSRSQHPRSHHPILEKDTAGTNLKLDWRTESEPCKVNWNYATLCETVQVKLVVLEVRTSSGLISAIAVEANISQRRKVVLFLSFCRYLQEPHLLRWSISPSTCTVARLIRSCGHTIRAK